MTDQKPLTVEQLRKAAEKGETVRYVYVPENPLDHSAEFLGPASFMDDDVVVVDDDPNACIDLSEFQDSDEAIYYYGGESFEGFYPGDKGTAKDQLKERVAKFLHEDIWAHWNGPGVGYLRREGAALAAPDGHQVRGPRAARKEV